MDNRASTEYIIETDSLSKAYDFYNGPFDFIAHSKRRKHIAVLENITVKIPRGKITGIAGDNGAGKTTFLKILATLTAPSSGTAHVDGYDIASDEVKIKRFTRLIDVQERSFYWRLTGRQNLEFFAALYGLYNENACQQIEEVSSLMGMDDLIDREYCRYSTGMRSRLAISRGLMAAPRLLLLDEPTRSLDKKTAEKFWSYIKKDFVMRQSGTAVFVTQDIEEVGRYAEVRAMAENKNIRIYDN